MGEPSAEALGMARELYGNDEAALAAALQRFMDVVEKAEALADKQHQALTRIVEPWERAKRQYEAGAAVVLGFKERAEKAEAALSKAKENAAFSLERRDVAEARLSELVSELRAELEDAGDAGDIRIDVDIISGLIAKYEGGERGGLCEHEQARKNCPACIYKRDKYEGGED